MNRTLRLTAALVLATACEIPTVLPPPPVPPGPGKIQGHLIIAQAGTSVTAPAAGARVRILSTSIETTANADGLFTLQPVSQTTGELLIQAEPDSSGQYQRQRIFDLAAIGAGPGQDINLGDVTLNPNASLTGKVVRGDMPDLTTGQGGTTIFVPQGPFTTYSGDDGSFVLDNMPQGTVTVTFFRMGYAPDTISGIMLSPGQVLQLSTVALALAPSMGTSNAGTITGSVLFDPSVSDPTMTVATAIGATASISFPIAKDRTFSVGLDQGVYDLTFAYPGYGTATASGILVLPSTDEALPPITLVPAPAGVDAGIPDAGMPPLTDGGSTSDGGAIDGGIRDGGADGGADAGPPGTPPVAVLASSGVVREGKIFRLDASGSEAPDAPAGLFLSYTWTQTLGDDVLPSFSENDSPLAATPTFTAPETQQTLGFTVTVTDTRTGLTAEATTMIFVVRPPTAVITPATIAAYAGTMVTLDGSGSTDPYDNALTYAWSTVSPSITLAAAAAPTVTFAAPMTQGTYSIQLIVSDLHTASDPAFAELQVVPASTVPAVTVGPAQTVGAGARVTLQATAVSPDPVTWTWTQTGASSETTVSLVDADTGTPSFTAPPIGATLTFQVTATNSNGTSSPATVSVTVISIPPTVTVDANQVVSSGQMVALSATGSAPSPISYQWVQLTGIPVTLVNADQATASFSAPLQAAVMTFQVTATTLAGSATATTTVQVNDSTPLVITSSDPPQPAGGGASDAGVPDGGLVAHVSGPWLEATATFNKQLAESSVSPTNVSLLDSEGNAIPSDVKYILAQQQIRVLPLVPLTPGGQYAFYIGAVEDLAAPPNVHVPQTIPFTARSPSWSTWTSTVGSTIPPNPGIASNDNQVFVFSTYSYPGVSLAPAVERTGEEGSLVVVSPASGGYGGGEPGSHRGFNTNGTLFGFAQNWQYAQTNLQIYWMNDGSPVTVNMGLDEYSWPFTDGQTLFSLYNAGSQLTFQNYNASDNVWGPAGGTLVHAFCDSNGTNAAGASGGGQNYVMFSDFGRCSGEVGAELYVASYMNGSFMPVAGKLSDGGLVTFNGTDPLSGIPRGTFVAGNPVFVWSDNDGTAELHAAVLDSTGTTPTWDLLSGLNDVGGSATFDIYGRGNVLFLAYAVSGGLYLRQIDLSDPGHPVFVDIQGPTAPSLNVSIGSVASHPELSVNDGTIYLTWAEQLGSSYTVQVRAIQ